MFIPDYKDELLFLFKNNPIGYNETKKVYSTVKSNNPTDFYMTLKK